MTWGALIAVAVIFVSVIATKLWIAPAVRDLDFMLRRGWGDE